jgi:hypothetical protein
MSSNKGMRTKTYTQITSLHSSNTPSACGGDPLCVPSMCDSLEVEVLSPT